MGATGPDGGLCGSLPLSVRSNGFLGTSEQIAVFVLLLHLPYFVLAGRQEARWVDGAGGSFI